MFNSAERACQKYLSTIMLGFETKYPKRLFTRSSLRCNGLGFSWVKRTLLLCCQASRASGVSGIAWHISHTRCKGCYTSPTIIQLCTDRTCREMRFRACTRQRATGSLRSWEQARAHRHAQNPLCVLMQAKIFAHEACFSARIFIVNASRMKYPEPPTKSASPNFLWISRVTVCAWDGALPASAIASALPSLQHAFRRHGIHLQRTKPLENLRVLLKRLGK